MLSPCYAQRGKGYVRHLVDSLDQIKAKTAQKVKPIGETYTIRVQNQEQFESINDRISEGIAKGYTNIRIKISKGTYSFYEDHIQRKDEHYPNVSISIQGKNAVITSYCSSANLGMCESEWTELTQTDELIEVVDFGKKLCKIPFKNTLSTDKRKRFTKVQVTQWFLAPIYDVCDIDETGVYFIAQNLKEVKNGYNVNYDYEYLGKKPHFRLFDTSKERLCSATTFLSMTNCEFHSLSIAGLTFKRNKAGGGLMELNYVAAQSITIEKSTFEEIQGYVTECLGTDNVLFDHNIVRNTAGHEVRFLSGCRNVSVTRNLFENCGQSLNNTICVTCGEAEYYIANNEFRDFGRIAIAVGVWHGSKKHRKSGGIIEKNQMYFTPDYLKRRKGNVLMDSGAIYTWTQNDGVIIRYNYIHDYEGLGDNRGIFCDDGASNLKIYGNVILNTPNSYCIDLRSINDNAEGFLNNANNLIAYNVVENGIRFEGCSQEERHNAKGTNIVLSASGKTSVPSKFNYLENSEEDTARGNLSSNQIKKFIKRK